MNRRDLWQRYSTYLCDASSIGLRLDISRMGFDETFFERLSEPMGRALAAMEKMEGGAKANLDENRRVGHYWLRAPQLAPDPTVRAEIERTLDQAKKFAAEVHAGGIRPRRGDGFYVGVVVGIGGSALGPQLVADALGTTDDPMILHFLDNTDPDGFDRLIADLDETLAETLTIVISKSGKTVETRNGMIEMAAAYRHIGLSLPQHAVAVTEEGSELHQKAVGEKWLATFPMWDWVGGRTSVTSAVGWLPAALQGIDIDAFLAGARDGDVATREREILKNPAALLALMWFHAAHTRGRRSMVVLPYRDRLGLFARYLQQLVMESLGKERDRAGKTVHEGLTVYGNKGTTDQHALVQQLLEGPNDFFVTFVEVLRDRREPSLSVEPDVTSGDYLHAFLHGTREALSANGRESITLTLDELTAHRLGALIAVYERAVGLYAELINVNAYHQPGVEAGKRAAGGMIELQRKVLAYLRANPGHTFAVEGIATAIGQPDAVEAVFHVLEHTSANSDHGIRRMAGKTAAVTSYTVD
jgi:glucose-6-phosphate isomerase